MKIPYSYAVVSYCPDLTDPDRTSLPVGVVGVAAVKSNRLLCMVIRRSQRGWTELSADPLIHHALEHLPESLERLAVAGLRKARVPKLMSWLGRQLTQSIHVSAVRENAGAVSVEDSSALATRLVAEFSRLYRRQLALGRPQRRSVGALPLVGVRPLRKALA